MIQPENLKNVIWRAKKDVVSELKTLTRTKTAKQLESAIIIWREMSDPESFAKVFSAPNREKAVLDACKKLRISLNANGIILFASINRFRACYAYLQYVTAMEAAHEQHWADLLQKDPSQYFGKK